MVGILADFRFILDFFKPYYSKHRMYIVLCVLFTAFHKLVAVALPILIKLLVDTIEKGTNFKEFVFYAELNILGLVVFLVVLFLRYYFEKRTETSISADLRQDMLQHILDADYLSVTKEETGYFLERQSADLQNINDLIVHDPVLFFIDFFYVGAIAVIMIKLNAVLFVALLALFPLFFVIARIILPKMKAVKSHVLKTEEEINSFTEESVSGAYHIKANNAENIFERRLSNLLSKYLGLNLSYATLDILYDLILFTGIMNVANLIVYILGGYYVFKGTFTVGSLFAFAIYFSNLWEAMEFYTQFPKELKISMLSVNRIRELLSIPQEQEGKVTLSEPIESIQFEDVSFSYDSRMVLNNVNLIIRRREKIGIVGPNGSGKSTFCNLLMRIITPSRGNIFINGIDYKTFTKESLRNKIILVPQEPYIFSGTLEENVTLFGSGAKKRFGSIDVETILRNKHCTILTKNLGSKLSGGEKKLIQLLRGINRNGDVYILDEPLAFVDKDYADLVLQLIKSGFDDKTLIIISHLTNLSDFCDRTYVITTEGSFLPMC
ncbi:hypothetical protein COPRO5265_1572 [Coprothermobacter proteolyticus DSM 5265]|uniref:ABC transporter, ATP-binding protein n=1 Tax=Coprothermobacter proteolyticus (strain ATCC 35245 / DSM 5265 / OCM 4 / BT) TaxID=309798 RepID=B5Y6E9_COPPD|nr:ABC transporter ATP-binding protein [Coprothermobacter proteolyticus]ACI18208.1 hypothetical protein COPRO5265_1572 [Coprothermobacter proteolyticus DSM 5265]